MGINLVGKGKIDFVHNVRFAGLPRASVVSCRARNQSLFTQILNENEAIVFGDFDIFICYKNDSQQQNNYETKIKKESFCKVIPFDKPIKYENKENQEIKISTAFTKAPDCRHKLISFNHSNYCLDINVNGEIVITLSLNEIEEEKEELIIKKTNIELIEKDKIEEEQKIDNKEDIDNKDNKDNKEDIEEIPTIEENKSIVKDENLDLKVLQFEAGIYSIEELMEMDFETLESISEK